MKKVITETGFTVLGETPDEDKILLDLKQNAESVIVRVEEDEYYETFTASLVKARKRKRLEDDPQTELPLIND